MPSPDSNGEAKRAPKLRATTRVSPDQIIITIGDVNAGMLFMADFEELRDELAAGKITVYEAADKLSRILDQWRASQRALDDER